MRTLIYLSSTIDRINTKIAQVVSWAILLSVLVTTFSALVLKWGNVGSNAWLEMQWYLYASAFMLVSAHTLKKNEHVRINILSSRLSEPSQAWLDIGGYLLFFFPIVVWILFLSIPYAYHSFVKLEASSNAGGLPEWPAKILIPLGFFLLLIQGLSEFIKKIVFLRNKPSDLTYLEDLQASEVRANRLNETLH